MWTGDVTCLVIVLFFSLFFFLFFCSCFFIVQKNQEISWPMTGIFVLFEP